MKLDIQRFADGTVEIKTELNTNDFDKGLDRMQATSQKAGSTIKNIVAGLGITKLISKGISVINNSIDGAVKRVDTLNNFPKVMSNLGISTEDAQKAIDKMSEKLAGLPTTLDEGAMAVQRFTSKNNDVKKSTDIFLALNNALLAGGASTEIQSSALEQLSQAYAKGKPDMMEWRALQTAMPAQLKQVAEAMGYAGGNVAELGEDLRKGNVSMDDFMDTIMKLNEKGLDGFQSFEEQARNSVGGIGTAITVAKTQVVKGVADMIGGINKGLKKNNLPELTEIIANVGKAAKKHLSNLGNLISKAISKINVEKVTKALKLLGATIVTVVTALASFNAVTKVISMVNLVKGIASGVTAFAGLTTSANLAGTALTTFSTLSALGPIGVGIVAVTTLTAGIVALAKATEDTTSNHYKSAQALEEYNKAMKNANEEKNTYLQENASELKHYEDLAAELDTLIDKNGKVKTGYEERAKFISGQLNDALGTEIKINNGIVEGYDKIQDKIYDVIEAKRAQYLMEANEKVYNESLKQRIELEKQYAEDKAVATQAESDYMYAYEKIMNAYGFSGQQMLELITSQDKFNNSLGLSQAEFGKLQSILQPLHSSFVTANEDLSKSKDAYLENEETISKYEVALGHMADKNYEAVVKMYEDTSTWQGKTDEETRKNLEKQILAQRTALDSLKKDKDKYDTDTYNAMVSSREAKIKELENEYKKYGDITTVGEDGRINIINKKSSEAKSASDKNVDNQLKAITSKNKDFETASKNNWDAVDKAIKNKGPSIQKSAKDATKKSSDEVKKGKQDFKDGGKCLMQGGAEGISENAYLMVNASTSATRNAVNAMKQEAQIKSPSRKTMELGKFLVQGLALGMEKEENTAIKEAKEFTEKVVSQFEDMQLDDVFTSAYQSLQEAVELETSKITANVETGRNYQDAIKREPTFNLQDNSTNQTQLVVNGKVLAEVVNTENKNREVAKA